MAENHTQDEVMQAARELGQPEFTRDDVAAKLGVERAQMKQGFKAARQAGQVELVRKDDDGTRHFRVAE